MTKLLSLYGRILRPWLCFIVYLWALEFRSAYGSDFEPLLDRLADCSAVLWTMIVWTLALCLFLLSVAFFFNLPTVDRFNTLAAKACVILTTVYHFIPWLGAWMRLYASDDVVGWTLVGSVLVLAIWSLCRYKAGKISRSDFPTFNECFSYLVVPILLASLVFLGIRIAAHVTSTEGTTLVSLAEGSPLNKSLAPPKPNIILMIADGLRAQSMSLFGHTKKTTLFLEKLAEKSDLYLDMHVTTTTTQPSVTSLLSGKHPFAHGRLSRELPPYGEAENLLRLLRDNGYFTAAITSNVMSHEVVMGFSRYFSLPPEANFNLLTLSWLRDWGVYPTNHGGRMYRALRKIFPFLGFPQRTSIFGDADDTLRLAKNMLSRIPQPFFLFIHFHEPHDPYAGGSTLNGDNSAAGELQGKPDMPPGFYAHYPEAWQASADFYRNQYEESIRFLDTELRAFTEFLEQFPWVNNLLLVFTADHGESFERGYLNHGEELYENSTRVPLIVRYPNQQQGRRISGLVQLADVAPTILDASDLPVPAWMTGQVLNRGGEPEGKETIALNFIHAEGGKHFPLPTMLAIWRKRYKLIVACDGSRTELYDLKADPQEMNNLVSEENGLVTELKRLAELELRKQAGKRKMTCTL